MKVPDSHQLEPNSYIEIKESWRTEWEAGVQVGVAIDLLTVISEVINRCVPTDYQQLVLNMESGKMIVVSFMCVIIMIIVFSDQSESPAVVARPAI